MMDLKWALSLYTTLLTFLYMLLKFINHEPVINGFLITLLVVFIHFLFVYKRTTFSIIIINWIIKKELIRTELKSDDIEFN